MPDYGALAGDFQQALEDVTVPSYVIDTSGVIRWVNPAAMAIVGDVRGRHFTSVVAPEYSRRTRESFTSKIVGTVSVTDTEVTLLAADRSRVSLEISSVPLRDGNRIVGVFGQLVKQLDDARGEPHPHLTPRQADVLRLLEHGRSTRQIAEELHLTVETVRNHVRNLLRALGVHSRIEAVATARRGGWLDD
jgi:PAS domain S-box-containing protein